MSTKQTNGQLRLCNNSKYVLEIPLKLAQTYDSFLVGIMFVDVHVDVDGRLTACRPS